MPDVDDQTKKSPHKQRQRTEYFDNHLIFDGKPKTFQGTCKSFTFQHIKLYLY